MRKGRINNSESGRRDIASTDRPRFVLAELAAAPNLLEEGASQDRGGLALLLKMLLTSLPSHFLLPSRAL